MIIDEIGSEMMVKRAISLFLISLLFILFVGCDLYTDEGSVAQEDVTLIDELEHIDNFRGTALKHILEGELNQKGQAVGFHYNQLPTKKGEIVQGTETEPNEFGVYEAKVIISDVEKKSNQGKSTFFPDNWDSQEVVDSINEAYDNKVFISGNTYEGLTDEGPVIRMYLDDNEKIISAFPIY